MQDSSKLENNLRHERKFVCVISEELVVDRNSKFSSRKRSQFFFGQLQDYFASHRSLPNYSYMQKMFGLVVAVIDNVFTVKTLGKENGQFVLIPANKDFATIRPKEGFEIFGIVVGQFRSY